MFLILNLLIICYAAICQDDHFEIINLNENDTSNHIWDFSINSFIDQHNELNRVVFSKYILDNTLDSLFKDSKYAYLGNVSINPKYKSLLFIRLLYRDTLEYLENAKIKMYLLNFNNDCKLISSALIARYEMVNSGLSLSCIDTELKFKTNYIKIKEIIDYHPTDMVIYFTTTNNSLKTKNKYLLKMDDTGKILQKK
jgi:hypothetical protein